MRTKQTQGEFKVQVIAGTRVVLMALDYSETDRHKLMGFAFQREVVGAANPGTKWLRSSKVFKSIVPDPLNAKDPHDPAKPRRFDTFEFPIQSLLWSDYTAEPDTLYKFTIVPMHGAPGALEPQPALEFTIRTEKEFDQGHGVWFNQGAIASQVFVRTFKNEAPKNPDDPMDPETQWLSRGLLDACLRFINETPPGDGLRVAAYEFTYKPVLAALKTALDRGVDVRIIYHDTTGGKATEQSANEKAIAVAGLPHQVGGKQVLFPRAQTKIPHNKFIVRLKNGTDPTMVWTGSTNFTPSGFLGQTNVGHLVADAATAQQYLAYWELLKTDPKLDRARTGAMKLTPNPPALVPANSIQQVFSPRTKSLMLTWYGNRIDDAINAVMFTSAFGITKALVEPLAKNRDSLRFILMEKPPTAAMKAELTKDRDVIISYGAVLGEMYDFKDGKPVPAKKIEEFELDKWLLQEDHFRHDGFVFFVHTKFLLIDPLSSDPLVCTGSANFSPDSLLANDENMLLIRGSTRVADIYLTEFDRVFRHFYFRDVANEVAAKGGPVKGVFLEETPAWTDDYFKPGLFKTRRREMFFADPALSWVTNAQAEGSNPAKKRNVRAGAGGKAKKPSPVRKQPKTARSRRKGK